MTFSQRLISFLVIGHVAATLVSAVPRLDVFGNFPVTRGDSEHVSPLTAALDRAAIEVIWLHRVAWAMTSPVRRVSNAYVRVTSLYQNWNMFWNPSRQHRYARVGYRLRLADGLVRTEYREVLPAGPADQWKLVSAYFYSFSDKALTVAGEKFRERAEWAESRGERLSDEEARDILRPYTRYYGHQRAETGLPSGGRLIAVEFWWGTSPIPPPGTDRAPSFSAASAAIRWERLSVDDQW